MKELSLPASIVIGCALLAGSHVYVMKGCPCKGADKDISAEIAAFVRNNPEMFAAKPAEPAAEPQRPEPPAEAPAALIKQILKDKTNHVLGNKKGKYVIIEFFDYQCGWCKRTNNEMLAKLKDAPNIRWILMDNPIFGPDSERIARYGMAAQKQGKFKEFFEIAETTEDKLDEEGLIAIGEKLGLNIEKLKADANNQAAKDKIAANRKISSSLNLNGVPMLIVDGKVHPGALIGEGLDEAVKASNEK